MVGVPLSVMLSTMNSRHQTARAELTLLASERAALDDFVAWLRERFGERLGELRLFGSRARGEGHDESDLDVLVTIDQLTSSERREVAQRSGDAMTHWDVLLSPFVVSKDHFAELRARERLIAREIDRDGVAL